MRKFRFIVFSAGVIKSGSLMPLFSEDIYLPETPQLNATVSFQGTSYRVGNVIYESSIHESQDLAITIHATTLS